jgi:lysophospholipid acyltransferase (LPLAT)-like uncharacterized protein
MPDTDQYRKEKLYGRVVWLIYRLYSATFRYRLHAAVPGELATALADLDDRNPKPGNNYIYAFWHQDELALLPYFRNRDLVAMVSDSRDGTIMATALECFGYLTTRGSSTRGGVKGFIASIRMIRKGYKFTMAVDGPKGPIYKTKEGIIRLSEKSGRPIFPFRAWPERFFTFKKAWNQAKLPLPFSKIHIMVGNAAMYSREELDEALNALTSPLI